MDKTEIFVLNYLREYDFIRREIERLRERANETQYRITPSYTASGGSSSGWKNSKVENMAIKSIDLQEQRRRIETSFATINKAIANTMLSEKERAVINHIIQGGSLSAYAREKGIYKSYVYKIRDNAVRKIADYIKHETDYKTG